VWIIALIAERRTVEQIFVIYGDEGSMHKTASKKLQTNVGRNCGKRKKISGWSRSTSVKYMCTVVSCNSDYVDLVHSRYLIRLSGRKLSHRYKMPTEDISSLAPVFLIFSLLLYAGRSYSSFQKVSHHYIVRIAVLGWCILSSCLGVPLSRLFASLQETSVLNSRPRAAGVRMRREPREDDGEIWEMEYRGRAG
jgi:hypothetical protein